MRVEFSNSDRIGWRKGCGTRKNGEGYVRIGLLIEPARLVEAVERIGNLYLFD